ncbi:hypothetical protein DMB92_05560 [Campylobacter sp. MIT 99-7217]|uniref:hypothetical protein n=1 Tax=Campylobacter sp. MIT 99-7217 TaxID=535091 RepID=UPI00115BA3D7|nr:hypothetical protein [Campylobacter sp. MIT 99-7217]TQR31853.1 hypothetical protein DMB92_05560 [Campylobacter sp. MIT 99-7217]
MLRLVFFGFLVLLFSACAPKSSFEQAVDLSRQQPCASCESAEGFEARIKGLIYLSDVGIRCCADKRTLDPSVALKKVYIHRVVDLPEENKFFYNGTSKYYLEAQFHASFYRFLEQELRARGIIVVEGVDKSPYTIRLDLSFVDFNSNIDKAGLRSNLSARVEFKNINYTKNFVVRTNQEVRGLSGTSQIPFYTQLLIKQMANKVASVISSI